MTVQLSLSNEDYAVSLAKLLSADGERDAKIVATPDLSVPGVIVVESHLITPVLNCSDPDRYVVVARQDQDDLLRLFRAGFSTVIFRQDNVEIAYLAILGVESKLRANREKRRQREHQAIVVTDSRTPLS